MSAVEMTVKELASNTGRKRRFEVTMSRDAEKLVLTVNASKLPSKEYIRSIIVSMMKSENHEAEVTLDVEACNGHDERIRQLRRFLA